MHSRFVFALFVPFCGYSVLGLRSALNSSPLVFYAGILGAAMKRFPKLWVLQAGALLILGFASVPMVCAIEQGPSGEYDIVESSRPDGKGGYQRESHH